MRILPFLILMIVASSCFKSRNRNKTETPLFDTLVLLTDTVVNIPAPYDRTADSIKIKRQRDSLYAIPLAYSFVTTGKSKGFDKLIASIIDTTAVHRIDGNFTFEEIQKYNKDSMPVSRTLSYTNSRYTIRVITTDLEDYQPKQIFINGKLLGWGSDIDTTYTGSDISYNIELAQEKVKVVKYMNKQFLYMVGQMESCNGNGCGLFYYLLYDPEIAKAIAVQQYRISSLYMGRCNNSGQLGFLVFGDYDYNYLYHHFTVTGKAFTFSERGKVVPARDAKGNQFFFDGYSVNDPDSISILKANLSGKQHKYQ